MAQNDQILHIESDRNRTQTDWSNEDLVGPAADKQHASAMHTTHEATQQDSFLYSVFENRNVSRAAESGTLMHTNDGNHILAPNTMSSGSVNWCEFYVAQYMSMTLVKGGFLEDKMEINTAMAKASSASAFYSQDPVSEAAYVQHVYILIHTLCLYRDAYCHGQG